MNAPFFTSWKARLIDSLSKWGILFAIFIMLLALFIQFMHEDFLCTLLFSIGLCCLTVFLIIYLRNLTLEDNHSTNPERQTAERGMLTLGIVGMYLILIMCLAVSFSKIFVLIPVFYGYYSFKKYASIAN